MRMRRQGGCRLRRSPVLSRSAASAEPGKVLCRRCARFREVARGGRESGSQPPMEEAQMSTIQELPPLELQAVPEPFESAPAAQPRPLPRVVPDVPLDFDDAVRRLSPRLQRYATRRLADAHEAEELVQEALLRAYKNRAALLTEDDVAAWTTVVVGRLVIDRLRVRGRSVNVAEVPEGV